jgi:uncharacterized protein DUF742
MSSINERWLDAEAGPVVRPYTFTRGRTRPVGEPLDLIAVVVASRRSRNSPRKLDPELFAVLRLCQQPTTVADLATDLDLPIGVVQVLLADLRERSLITVHNPIPPARLPDPQILRDVADALRRL